MISQGLSTSGSLVLSYAADGQTDRQTDKQTASNVLPTPSDIVGVVNYFTVMARYLFMSC